MTLKISQIFRVLAFGASHTEGHTGSSHTYPYAAHLQAPLESFFAAKDKSKAVEVKITVDGEGGDRVISPPGRFLPRLKRDCDAPPEGEKYDWVLVLGGTNDLGSGSKAKDIYDGLSMSILAGRGLSLKSGNFFKLIKDPLNPITDMSLRSTEKCWTVALESGANVLAINIMECADPDPDLIHRRKSLNLAIMDHKEKNVFVSPLPPLMGL